MLPFAYTQPVFPYRDAPSLPANPYAAPSVFTVAPSIVSLSPPINTVFSALEAPVTFSVPVPVIVPLPMNFMTLLPPMPFMVLLPITLTVAPSGRTTALSTPEVSKSMPSIVRVFVPLSHVAFPLSPPLQRSSAAFCPSVVKSALPVIFNVTVTDSLANLLPCSSEPPVNVNFKVPVLPLFPVVKVNSGLTASNT